ncbi:class I SAM-dependent methyltransferase [Embleya scabrispora]|uniref:class I SAM-dependent methyltransferase n=1 Tax=Embleya scabrispora TaxID=159449 RepID=UPI000477FACA|nr:class I SAM-dependent methyltransferase [Embleya scabrispora]MYS83533.1 methyltransferase domain-containing protein [Streptomyces sp. SID5474]
MTEERFDTWAAGDAYERYMGRWSRAVAAEFVAWLHAAPGLRWVDAGCGTGALTAAVVARCRPGWVLGLDRSAAFVARARAEVPAPAGFVVADAMAPPLRDGACDVVVSGLVLNFLPAPAAAVARAARVVRPGGTVAGYVWDYAEGMGFLRYFWAAAGAVDPAAERWDEGRRFARCRPDRLRACWERAGLADVAVVPIEVATGFAGFADLWEPFLAGQGPAPGYVAALSRPDRDRLRETLRASVPTRADGSIVLGARAWAIRGGRPGRAHG